MTHLQIINRALIIMGEVPITAIGTSDISVAIEAFYESVWTEVLSSHPWSSLTVMAALDPAEDDDDEVITDSLGRNAFAIPTDCVRLQAITDETGRQAPDAAQTGGYLYSRLDKLVVTYVSSSGIIPLDMDDAGDEIAVALPPYMQDAVYLKLASDLSFQRMKDGNMQTTLYNRHIVALQNAKMSDSRGSGGETLWGAPTYSPVPVFDEYYMTPIRS